MIKVQINQSLKYSETTNTFDICFICCYCMQKYRNGAILRDREQDSDVIVTNLYSTRCDQFRYTTSISGEEQTVYESNEQYDYVAKTDPVVSAVYCKSMMELIWRSREQYQDYLTDINNQIDLTQNLTDEGREKLVKEALMNNELTEYYFPITRLSPNTVI